MEKLEWRVDLTQVSQSLQILVNAPSKISATHDTRRYPRVIRSSFQRIVSYYLFFGSLVGTSKCSSHKITVYLADKIKIHKQAMSKRDRERVVVGRRAELTLLSLLKSREFILDRDWTTRAPTSIAETFANVRKHYVRFTHATVPIAETFGNMRKRRAD